MTFTDPQCSPYSKPPMQAATKVVIGIAVAFVLLAMLVVGVIVGAVGQQANATNGRAKADARIQCSVDNIGSPTTRPCR